MTFDGDHVGLYGGTLNTTTCDKGQLILFLTQNPDKGAAWAGVLGIPATQIPAYVTGLTSVLLRSDTLVTNHGYANGLATVIPAVLQAGTAVLVDDKGFPVTKCYCGNPLTPPTYYSPGYEPSYYGPTWQGFSGTSITIIQNSTTIINTYTLVDPRTKQPFERPRGSDGTLDTPTNPTPTTAPTTQPPVTTLPTVTVPQTQPPPTQPPPTQPPPTQPPGPTPEQRAVDKLIAGSEQCYPFPAPIQQGYGREHHQHRSRRREPVHPHRGDPQHERLEPADVHLERQRGDARLHTDQRPRAGCQQPLRRVALTHPTQATRPPTGWESRSRCRGTARRAARSATIRSRTARTRWLP